MDATEIVNIDRKSFTVSICTETSGAKEKNLPGAFSRLVFCRR